jgi:hypothetical protein
MRPSGRRVTAERKQRRLGLRPEAPPLPRFWAQPFLYSGHVQKEHNPYLAQRARSVVQRARCGVVSG